MPQNARPDSRLAAAWAFAELSKEDELKAEANPHISAGFVHDGAICPRKQFAVRGGANRERVLFEQDEVEVEFRRNESAFTAKISSFYRLLAHEVRECKL